LKIAKFLEIAMRISLDEEQPDVNHPLGSLSAILTQFPNHSPLREHIPAKKVITSPESAEYSPFLRQHINSRYGFFSVLVWRIITYSSQCADDGNILLGDLKEWNAIHNEYKDTPQSIFVEDAYHNSLDSSRRYGIRNVHKLWKFSETWPKFLKNREEVSLGEMFEYLRNSGCACLGDGMSYMIAADYVYGDFVSRPSVETVGCFVWRLQGDSLQCLQLLGLLPSPVHIITERETIQAFTDLFDFVQPYLADLPGCEEESLDDEFGFDAVTLEFALQQFFTLNQEGFELM
ncbi:hypothetical protein K474DRAFT_1680973, partial [Panus rudis PR-1116 ss-1]